MPNDFWAIVTLLSLAGWILSTLVFIFKAFPERGVFDPRSARTWGVAVLAFYTVWLIGMLLA